MVLFPYRISQVNPINEDDQSTLTVAVTILSNGSAPIFGSSKGVLPLPESIGLTAIVGTG